ncbi:MAG: hypothetical protein Kow009_02960 [Spirochaetales bacterium]
MNRYFPVWGKVSFLCMLFALLLGVVHGSISSRSQERERQALEGLLRGWKKDVRFGTDLIPGMERMVPSQGPVKSFIPLRSPDGKVELYVVRLIPGEYIGAYPLRAVFTSEGKLVGCTMDRGMFPNTSTFSNPSPSLLGLFLDHEDWISGSTVHGPLESREAEVISGATCTFLSILKALQEGSAFVREKRSHP